MVIGRIGDLVIADHLGKTTSFFLGYKCPPLEVATGSPCAPTEIASRTVGAVVHQTALYDQLLAAVLLAVLLVLRRRPRYDGFLITVFGAGYACARILEDFLRDDLRHFGLTGSQITAVATLAVCLFVLVVRRRTPRWGGWDSSPPPAPSLAGLDKTADRESAPDGD